MEHQSHEKLYDILLSMKEDIGEMKSDIKSVKTAAEDTSKTVKKHDEIISNWQGRIAIIGAIVGVVSTTIISWIRKELNS